MKKPKRPLKLPADWKKRVAGAIKNLKEPAPMPQTGGVLYKRVTCCNPGCPGHIVE